jgi:integrase
VFPYNSLECFSGGDTVATNIRISKRTVDALVPREKPFIKFDQTIAGFGVRVMPNGTKSFILEYRPGAGGRTVAKKRLTLGRYGAMTADQAREPALDALARIRLGDDPQAEKARQRTSLTVAGLIEAFIEGHAAKLKPKSLIAYRSALDKLTAVHGAQKAERLSRSQVSALHRSLSDSPYAANRVLSAVSKMFSWSESVGLVLEGHANPARGITRYREEGRERYLTGDELARLGDALREGESVGLPYPIDDSRPNSKHAAKPENRLTRLDPFACAAIRLLILTGARLHEILDAQWAQLDLDRGVMFLTASKTGKKPLHLSAPALAVLASIPRIESNPFVIPGALPGQPRRDLKKPWAAATARAGLQALRIHDLRHSYASFGAGASLGLPVIGRLLGHATPATTARYSHLADDPVRRAAETIGATIDGAMNRTAGGNVVKMK